MHQPVLLQEVLDIFDPKPGEVYIDATINGGGHAMAILERVGPTGKVVGIDWDCGLLEKTKDKSEKIKAQNLILTCDNYANLRDIAREFHLEQVSGILFDCGFSSYHVEESHRGFSFLRNEPLDMCYHDGDGEKSLTAKKVVNTYDEKELADIFWDYGGERFSRRIAKKIVEERRRQPFKTTFELVRIIEEALPSSYRYRHGRRQGEIHFATRTFQALRIAVNGELENLERGLNAAVTLLKSGGKLAVISFHSLEDRIVKNFFKAETVAERLAVITVKPVRPQAGEIKENPRSRSAKLRVAQKL